MTVGADDTSTGLSPRTGTTTVSSINEDGGTITLASAAAITSFADNDYLFRAGDPGTCMEGMESLTPLTAPSASESFRGIDRSVDVYGLPGVRINDTSASIIQNMGLCAVRAGFRGKKLKKGVLNPINFWTVSQLLGAKVEYDGGGGTAEVGFEYISHQHPGRLGEGLLGLRLPQEPLPDVRSGRALVSEEPIRADNPLLSARNCLLTPHIAWATVEARRRLMHEAAENLRAFLAGDAGNRVN